jgi:hypothetical protein
MRVIVSRSGIPLVAAGEVDRRRHVWVNLALSGWDQTADFVVFFTNVFDWLGGPGGGEGDAYIAQLPISTGPVPTAGSGVESYRNRSARPRQGWAVLAAAAFSVAAVVVWPENRLQK